MNVHKDLSTGVPETQSFLSHWKGLFGGLKLEVIGRYYNTL
jgi:hypothetical protein